MICEILAVGIGGQAGAMKIYGITVIPKIRYVKSSVC